MSFKKIDLKKGQTCIFLSNNTGLPIDINRINKHDEVYDGFEITVILEKPTVPPTGDNDNTINLRPNTRDSVVTGSNLCLQKVSSTSPQSSIVEGPSYYASTDTYPENQVCIVKLTWSEVLNKWIESSRNYATSL